MSDYTYTVETLGDDTLTDSIIMRTVTEVIDSILTPSLSTHFTAVRTCKR